MRVRTTANGADGEQDRATTSSTESSATALPLLDEGGIDRVARTARSAIGEIQRLWRRELEARPATETAAGYGLGWMGSEEYLQVARRSLEMRVLSPFAARGIDLSPAAR
jgi:hypothetical protein